MKESLAQSRYDALGNGYAIGSVVVGTGLSNAGRAHTVRMVSPTTRHRFELERHLDGRRFWTFDRYYRVVA